MELVLGAVAGVAAAGEGEGLLCEDEDASGEPLE